MFLQNEKITVSVLKRLCKYAKIKCLKLKKQELIDLYNCFLAVKKIQNVFRKVLYREAVDPITLDPVYYPCFIYRTNSGKCQFYAYDSIIKYIMKTGNTTDPLTREQYSDECLKRLDNSVKIYFPEIKYKSTYKIKIDENYARRIKNRENELLTYQMRMSELKNYIVFIVESQLTNFLHEPILIENINYRSVESFINSTFHELKIVLNHLRTHDTQTVSLFKHDLLEQIPGFFTETIENL